MTELNGTRIGDCKI
jgi:hypothetical protein